MSARQRVQLEPAFLLHHRPYRDSSRILELYAHEHGRVSLFAKGARRAGSALAPVLQPFVPLLVSWTGSGDGGTLTGAELAAAPAGLPPARLMSGFYLNELLLRLVPRQDPHPELYEAYALALEELRTDPGEARALRLFEKRLLEALGWGLDYARVATTGAAVEPDGYYHVRPEHGVLGRAERADAPGVYAGRDLLSLAAELLDDAASLAAARRLLRAQLDAPLEGRELRSRTVARAVLGPAKPNPPRVPTDDDDQSGGARTR
jgi:DNA repair protein RecO (recombination protein O)